MKRFLIKTSVKNTEGTQTWYVDAASEHEALKIYERGGCSLYSSEVEVTALEDPEISGETTLDDFGDFAEQPAQPAQQEPVLQEIEQYRLQLAGISTAAIGYWKEGDGIHPDYDTPALRDVAKLYAKYDALYTSPPAQRTWVGLTHDEYDAICDKHSAMSDFDFLEDIEAKLKEKNT